MSTSNGILKHHIERLPAITEAVLQRGRRRAADTAVSMSQRGAMKAAADRCNAAINRLIELAYQTDDCGLCNVDAQTGVFNRRFSMPWSTRNYGRYGLLRTEADVLAIHINRLHDVGVPLFTFDDGTRRWALNFFDYPSMADAQRYAKSVELSARDYQVISQKVRNKRGG